MSFCMGCGKQIESGDYCTECSANMQQSQNTAADTAQAPVIPAAEPVVQAAPAKVKVPRKKIFNGKMIAMLSLLGAFGAMTIVVGVLFN